MGCSRFQASTLRKASLDPFYRYLALHTVRRESLSHMVAIQNTTREQLVQPHENTTVLQLVHARSRLHMGLEAEARCALPVWKPAWRSTCRRHPNENGHSECKREKSKMGNLVKGLKRCPL